MTNEQLPDTHKQGPLTTTNETHSWLLGEDALNWAGDRGLVDGQFFVPRSNGETDYGGWNIESVYDHPEHGRIVRVSKPSPDEDGRLIKDYPAIDLFNSQVTPSGRANITALRAAVELEQNITLKTHETSSSAESVPESELARDILQYVEFMPAAKITASGREFSVSAPINGNGRSFSVLYAEKDGEIVPRLLYKSNSAGDWRVAYRVEEADGRYAKEVSKDGHAHYTQENKIHDEIADTLDALAATTPPINAHHSTEFLVSKFYDTNPKATVIDTAEDEIKFDEDTSKLLAEFSNHISAGELSANDVSILIGEYGSISSYFESLDAQFQKLPGFIPDFSVEPKYVKNQKHPILGEYKVEAFDATLGGIPILWTLAYDKAGRTWIDGIKYTEMSPSSYGTGDTIIDSGILTSKPIDYIKQTEGLVDDVEKVEMPTIHGYRDISGVLAKLKPIRDFKASKNL